MQTKAAQSHGTLEELKQKLLGLRAPLHRERSFTALRKKYAIRVPLHHFIGSVLRYRGARFWWDCLRESFRSPKTRKMEGREWSMQGETLVGRVRFDNVQTCVEDVLSRGVPGDLCEAGVWKGGVTILMRAILKEHGITDRRVWVADSFDGLPPPNEEAHPHDRGSLLHMFNYLAVSREEVEANFRKYGLLDKNVRFLEGWFHETLPSAPIEKLALLRIDCDMYESTKTVLDALYDKVSPGGYVIVDDYGAIDACKNAVEDFRTERSITVPLTWIDHSGVYWQTSS